MMAREKLFIGGSIGVLVSLGTIYLLDGLLEDYWLQGRAWVLDDRWYSVELLFILFHITGGFLGGSTSVLISREAGPGAFYLVSTVLLAFGGFQIIGDWGHPSAFFWHLSLVLVTLAGVFLGWKVAARVVARS